MFFTSIICCKARVKELAHLLFLFYFFILSLTRMVHVSQLRENFRTKEEECFIQLVAVITMSLLKSYNSRNLLDRVIWKRYVCYHLQRNTLTVLMHNCVNKKEYIYQFSDYVNAQVYVYAYYKISSELTHLN